MYDPFEEMERFRMKIDKMFRFFLREPEFRLLTDKKIPTTVRQPLSDIIDKGKSYEINIELPGVDKKDIQLSITDDHVEVKAEKKHEVKVEKRGFHSLERSYKSFHRILPLPSRVNADKAEAEYKDGLLRIKIPKKESIAEKKKKIKIK